MKPYVHNFTIAAIVGVLVGFFVTFIETSETITLEIADIFPLIAILASLAGVLGAFYGLRKSSLSDIEVESELVREDIKKIRKKIEKSKDEEAAKKLRSQEQILRAELDEKLSNKLQELLNADPTDWKSVLLESRSRLQEEKLRLAARSRGSLHIALFLSLFLIVTLIGLIVYTIIYGGPTDLLSIATRYGPFLTLFLLVQILAGFFLKMYAQSEADIVKNKNEVTNIELRLTAGTMVASSKAHMAKLAEVLISEERNFVLNKKEKSTFLPNNDHVSELLKTIQTLAKK
ncbi:hypothetical protein N9W89_09725 [Hellea sp.]|nr:hypothetical protein [Hellea sp.]